MDTVKTPDAPGKATLLCGPMYSGKTARLIQMIVEAQQQGRRVLYYKHAYDVGRHPSNPGALISRTGETLEGSGTLLDFSEIEDNVADFDIVAIDEAQFFDPANLFSGVKSFLQRGKDVWLSALNSTSDLAVWDSIARVMPLLSETITLHARCEVCGVAALHSYRIPTPYERTHRSTIRRPAVNVVASGDEKSTYEPRCTLCFDFIV